MGFRLSHTGSVQRSYSTVSASTILAKAMPLVALHGWDGALIESYRSLGMSDQGTALFAKDDLIRYHYDQQLQHLKLLQPQSAPGYRRLEELLTHRLIEGNKNLGAGRLADAISITCRSRLVPSSSKLLSDISDELWYLAGDRSTDTTWYTRRGSLIAVYAACEIFQSKDSSHGFRDTKALIKNLISKLENVAYAENSIVEWIEFNTRGAFNVLKTLR